MTMGEGLVGGGKKTRWEKREGKSEPHAAGLINFFGNTKQSLLPASPDDDNWEWDGGSERQKASPGSPLGRAGSTWPPTPIRHWVVGWAGSPASRRQGNVSTG
jgi:hypothetical protein